MLRNIYNSIDSGNRVSSLINLRERWNDEKEFEDFKEYEVLVKKWFNDKDIIKVTKRPFGFKFKENNHVYQFGVKTKCNYIIIPFLKQC